MLINDNNKKPGVVGAGASGGSHDMDLSNPADVAGRRGSLHSAEGSMLPSAILNGSGVSNMNHNYSAPASRHRSSFDTNAKIGSFAHTNDHMKSPYLSSFPAFRHSSFASAGTGFDNANSIFQQQQQQQQQQQSQAQAQPQSQPQPPSSNGSSMAPPLSSPSMILSSYNNGTDMSNISPLSPQKSSFSDVPPLSQDMFTSPLTKPHEFANLQRLSFPSSSASNSMGIFPNIEELALDTFDLSDKSVGDATLLAPLPNQYDQQLHTRSSLGSVWSDTANNTNSANNSSGMGFQLQNANNNAYNWSSPPMADFQPLRRYSYDAASAATFIPNRSTLANYDFNMNMNLATNYVKGDFGNLMNKNKNPTSSADNAMNSNNNNNNNNLRPMFSSSSSSSNNNYSRHSSAGANAISQFNNPTHGSNIISPTKEQVIRSNNDVSNYLGVPSTEVLNMEKYLSYLNTSSLPQLTYLTDAGNLSNYEIIACCFKNSRIDVFHISPINKQLLGEIKLGDLVIVEADRGRDLGKVVKLNVSILEARLLRYAQYLGRKAALSKEDENHKRPVLNFPKPVIRFAKNEELLTINSKINDEVRAVEVCQNKVAEYNLDMEIVDAEYQWDMKKLTFYYNSEVRIDFRDLVKELFRVYKIRIWMSKQGGIC